MICLWGWLNFLLRILDFTSLHLTTRICRSDPICLSRSFVDRGTFHGIHLERISKIWSSWAINQRSKAFQVLGCMPRCLCYHLFLKCRSFVTYRNFVWMALANQYQAKQIHIEFPFITQYPIKIHPSAFLHPKNQDIYSPPVLRIELFLQGFISYPHSWKTQPMHHLPSVFKNQDKSINAHHTKLESRNRKAPRYPNSLNPTWYKIQTDIP